MITLRNITLRRGTKVVLQNASVTLQPGEKVGLIGRNGAGKSSLFALLTHRLQADAGEVDFPTRWRIGEVAQDMPETEQGVLVLEIGNEREHFDAAFPRLEAAWLETSAGDDQVLLLTREALT